MKPKGNLLRITIWVLSFLKDISVCSIIFEMTIKGGNNFPQMKIEKLLI